jgi:hypothetical protein
MITTDDTNLTDVELISPAIVFSIRVISAIRG